MLRLKKHSQYQSAYKKGRAYKDNRLALYVLKNGSGENRVGVTVSSKVVPLSVRRNRAKRLILESYRSAENALEKGFDIVFKPKGDISFLSLNEVRDEMLRLCKKARLYD